jgi:hypothetical protein
MLKKLTIISLMFFTAAVALPAAASAQGAACGVYCEEVPGAGGPDGGPNDNGGSGTDSSSQDNDTGTAGSGGSTSSSGTTPLSDEAQGGFDAMGRDGRAAAQLAQQGSPDTDALGKGLEEMEADQAGAAVQGGPGSSPELLGLAGGSADDDDGLGIGLPIALGVTLLGAVAFLILRRRSRSLN